MTTLATLATLVVSLKATTGDFVKDMKDAESQTTGLLGKLGGGVRATGDGGPGTGDG